MTARGIVGPGLKGIKASSIWSAVNPRLIDVKTILRGSGAAEWDIGAFVFMGASTLLESPANLEIE